MRLLVTSDLHFDHGRTSRLALDAARDITELGRRGEYDALLVIGDTATSSADNLEKALSTLDFPGPRFLTLGNHELWSRDPRDTLHLYLHTLPARIAPLGWHLLDAAPARLGDVAIVGNVGWYDYAFIPDYLGIPRRFYEAKISPGSAAHYDQHAPLLSDTTDIPPEAMEIFARWNDGRFVRWPDGFSDLSFTQLLLDNLRNHLDASRPARSVVVALHHLPRHELLPPRSSPAWDFAKAYLGSPSFGELLDQYDNIAYVLSGHSHFPAEHTHRTTRYLTTGSGYREKKWMILEV